MEIVIRILQNDPAIAKLAICHNENEWYKYDEKEDTHRMGISQDTIDCLLKALQTNIVVTHLQAPARIGLKQYMKMLKRNTSITNLSFQLSDPNSFNKLMEVLKTNGHITYLFIGGNDAAISDNELQNMAHMVDENITLKTIKIYDFNGNYPTTEGCEFLYKSVTRNETLIELSMDMFGGRDPIMDLAEQLDEYYEIIYSDENL